MTGQLCLYAVGKVFPLFLRKFESDTQIEYIPLPGPSFCSNRLNQFVGEVFFTVLLVFVQDFSDKHVPYISPQSAQGNT